MDKPKPEIGRWDETDPRLAPGPRTPLSDLETLAWILDSSIQLPGVPFRIGLDAIIGLVPVIGDLIGALLSAYILVMAARQGVPRVTLLRMGFNVTLEAMVGVIPVVGDVFDMAWKANLKNVALLRAHLENPNRAKRADWGFAALFLLGVAGLFALLGWGAFALGHAVLAHL
jgi:hypothetical protein